MEKALNLKTILGEMGIPAEFAGDQQFDTLGLIGTSRDERICSFVKDEKYLVSMSDSVVLLITTRHLADVVKNKNLCVVDDPGIIFFLVHNELENESKYCRGKCDTVIGSGCKISGLAHICDHNVHIGNDVVIEEFVSIKENVFISDNTIIRAGSVVGGEGFEHKRIGAKAIGVKHLGGVVIGADVELQQGTYVDKAVFPWDDTVVGDCCRTDNQVHIAHGVKMGKRVFIAAQAMLAGRVQIGDDVWIGPSAAISNGIIIGDFARITIGAVVTKDVPVNQTVSGNFAICHERFIDHMKRIR